MYAQLQEYRGGAAISHCQGDGLDPLVTLFCGENDVIEEVGFDTNTDTETDIDIDIDIDNIELVISLAGMGVSTMEKILCVEKVSKLPITSIILQPTNTKPINLARIYDHLG